MPFLGTIINTAAILVGCTIGCFFRKRSSTEMEQALMPVLGLCSVVIAGVGLVTTMVRVDPESGALRSSGELLLLISLAVGVTIGTLLRLDDRLGNLGTRIEKKLGAEGFARGFISASVLFCVGAMTVMGCFEEGLLGESKLLLLKSVLDFTSSIILTAALGVGVFGAALTVLVYQGLLTALAGALSPVLTGELLNNICIVGYAIVAVIGINLFGKTEIKTANYLPALLVPIVVKLLTGA